VVRTMHVPFRPMGLYNATATTTTVRKDDAARSGNDDVVVLVVCRRRLIVGTAVTQSGAVRAGDELFGYLLTHTRPIDLT